MDYKDIMKRQKRSRSISQVLARETDTVERKKIVLDWFKRWNNEHQHINKRLNMAVATNDYAEIVIALGEIRKMTERRIDTMGRIQGVLTEGLEPDVRNC